jgi:hypothetical protein
MEGTSKLQQLCTFHYEEGGVDKGKQIREKANLIIDLLHNNHKLEAEREAAS